VSPGSLTIKSCQRLGKSNFRNCGVVKSGQGFALQVVNFIPDLAI
jgi:hypothetical protein